MFKKFLSCLLITVMVVSMTACSSKKASESSGKGGANTEAAKESSTKPVEIEFWFGLGGNLGELFLGIIDDFNASQKEVVVKGVQQSNYTETEKVLQAAIAAKEVPACVLGATGMYMLQDRGIFEVLDDYVAADSDFNFDDIMDGALSLCYDDQKRLIGLPIYATTQIMYYRKDAFEKAGLNPDEVFKSWENLSAAAEKLAVKENGETTFYGWEPMYDASNMIDAVYSRGGSVLSEDKKTVCINDATWVDTWESFRKWIHDDKIMTIHFGGEGYEYWYKTIDDVLENRAAGYTGSSGDQGDLDFNIVAAHIQPGWDGHDPKPEAGGPFLTILADASKEQKEAAFKFATYLTSAEVQCKISMNSGYIPVRESCLEVPEFKDFTDKNPQAKVPMEQLKIARGPFIDPTGGKINQALFDAADLVEIENKSAKEALDQAQKIAQAALNEYWADKE